MGLSYSNAVRASQLKKLGLSRRSDLKKTRYNMNFTEYTDDELSRALHCIDGHGDAFEGFEARAWAFVKERICRVADQNRELDKEDA